MSEPVMRLYNFASSVRTVSEAEELSDDEIKSIISKSALMPDTVVYIPNYRSGKLVYHKGFDTILGYPVETKIDIQFVFDIVHPDDQPFVHYLSELAMGFHLDTEIEELFSSMFVVNCRIRKYNGDYMMMLRRSTGFLIKAGVAVATACFMHDIDFMSGVNQVSSRIIGPKTVMAEYQRRLDELNSVQPKIGCLSNREAQVLQLMAQGLRSAEISARLSRSVHTINNHRKNMIRKTGLQNTADLVRYGLENGLI